MNASSVEISSLRAAEQGDYSAYLAAQADACAYHSLAWRDLLCRVYGYQPHYLLARDAGVICGVLPLMMVARPWSGRHLSALPFSHRVPVLATPMARTALLQAAQRLARECGARYLEVREDAAMLNDAGFAPAAGYWQSLLDLGPAEQDLWRQVRSATRRNVARAERVGVTVRRAASTDDHQRFYQLMLETRRQQGTPPYPRRLFDELARLAWTRLYLAHDAQGTTLAGLCIFMHEGQALYAYGASSKRAAHLEQRPNDLLFWRVIAELRAAQVTTLDFGISPEHLGELRRFKENWGAVSTLIHHARWSPRGVVPQGVARGGLLARCATQLIRHTPTPLLAWAGNRFFKYFG